jgi:glyoxylase-like metal-dependent hydrolase (beta-lactamase superfamily II)
MHRFLLDEFECVVLNTGRFTMNAATFMSPASPQARASACEKYGFDPDAIVFQMNPLVVNTGQHRVLVDPGTSFDVPKSLINTLHEAGISPGQITAVIITHGHSDHFNGSVNEDGTPAFPNAHYYVQRAEWEHWFAEKNPEPHHAAAFQNILGSIKERVIFLEGEGEIVPGFEAVHTPGHSPAHMAVLVDKRMMCVGDVLQNEVYIEHPEWVGTFDCWPRQVVSTRLALLRRIVDEKLLVSTFHFALPGIGYVVPEGDTYRWEGGREV